MSNRIEEQPCDHIDTVVAEPQVLKLRKSSKGGAALLKNGAAEDDDDVARGREAWQRLKAENRKHWEEWVLIGTALCAGREQVMAVTKAKKPIGKKYNVSFGHWLQIHGFADIDAADRNKLMLLM